MEAKASTENPFGVPVVSRPDEVEHHAYYASSLEVILKAEATGGQYFMVRGRTIRPEDSPPFHLHTREDEIWIVNSGTFRFWIGGESLATATTYDVGPGAVVYGPRNVAHSFQVIEGTGDLTFLLNPAESQSYFLEVGEAEGREDFEHPDRLEAIGVRVLDRAPINGA